MLNVSQYGVVGALALSVAATTLFGQQSSGAAGCGEPSELAGLVIGRALTSKEYEGMRARLAIQSVNLNHIRALTDEEMSNTCSKLRSALKGWPYVNAAATDLHYFEGDGYYFVSASDVRKSWKDKLKRHPRVAVIKDGRVIGTIQVHK